jgi:CubicO group peptidase (beta-lactamase class C family)
MILQRRAFLASASAALGACASTQTAAPDTAAGRAVRAVVDRVTARQRLAGVQYIVLHRGQTIAEGVSGAANLDTGTPVTHDTLFLIASITKLMTSAAVLRLADRSAFDLDAPVQHYVPDFPTHPDGVATPALLMNHMAGIRHYNRERQEPTREVLGTHYPTAAAAVAVFRDGAYITAPNTQRIYSSYGYALLAACLEAATGKTFTQILQDEIFTPAGMSRASVPDMRVPIPGLAHSYSFYTPVTGEESQTLLRARENDFSYNPGGGNVISDSRSVAAFGQAMLRPGLLSEARWREIVGDPWAIEGQIADGANYALDGYRHSWPIWHDRRNRRFIHNSGASEAYQGGLTFFPEEELVICGLSNTWGIGSRDGSFTATMHVDIADAVLAA